MHTILDTGYGAFFLDTQLQIYTASFGIAKFSSEPSRAPRVYKGCHDVVLVENFSKTKARKRRQIHFTIFTVVIRSNQECNFKIFSLVFYVNLERSKFKFWDVKPNHTWKLITVQQDETVFSLLHFCRQLYMFRVLTPIIRSWYSCNYSSSY